MSALLMLKLLALIPFIKRVELSQGKLQEGQRNILSVLLLGKLGLSNCSKADTVVQAWDHETLVNRDIILANIPVKS